MENSELENEKFGSYQLLECLGNGGMGGVYRAEDTGLQREVAIKVMLPKLGEDEELVESFRKEAQAAAKLNNPHIAQIYAFGNENGKPFIAMELLKGGSLDKKMKNGPMDPVYIMKIGRAIAMGLSAAADEGLVHGDVKPENILFNEEGEAKLVDFGIAALMGSTDEIWGTPFYISPEKVQKRRTDLRADIYSLGATLYHAICGHPPFDGKTTNDVVKARFNGAPPPMRNFRPDIPQQVQDIIGRMLALEPSKRYPTYISLIKDIERFLYSIGGSALPSARGKKLVIKGKGGAPISPPSNVGTIQTTVNGTLTTLTPVQTMDTTDNSADQNKGCKIFAMITVGLIVFLALVGGGVWWYLKSKDAAAVEAAQEQAEEHQSKTRANLKKFIAIAQNRVKELEHYPTQAMHYAQSAENQAVKVVGEKWRKAMRPQKPEPIPLPEIMKPAQPEGEKEEKKEAAIVAPKTTKELQSLLLDAFSKAKVNAQSLQKVYALHKQGSLPELPENITGITNALQIAAKSMTSISTQSDFDGSKFSKDVKELLKMFGAVIVNDSDGKKEKDENEEDGKKSDEEEGEKKPEEAKPEEGKDTAENAAPAEQPEPEPPVVKMVRTVYTDAYDVVAAFEFAQRVLAAIEENVLKERDITGTSKEALEELAKLNNKIKEMVDVLAYDKNITGISRKMSILEKSGKTIAGELEIFIGLQRIAQREAERKAKAKAEEERKLREAEALKAKTEEERSQIAGVEAGNIELIKKLDFNQADRNLRDISDNITTDDGRYAYLTARERIRRLKDFHNFLITKSKGYHSAKGWVINDTDRQYLTVGKNKVQWREVYNERIDIFGELIMQFVGNSRSPMLRQMGLKEKTKLMTDAALALSIFCASNQNAMKLARDLAQTAATKMEAYADDIKALVPALFNESSDDASGDGDASENNAQDGQDQAADDADDTDNTADDADFEE